jgi:hypothetical protein
MARRKNPRRGRGRKGNTVCSDRTSIISPGTFLSKLCREIKVLREFRPLALGIDLPARGVTPDLARRALIAHCRGRRYLEAVERGGARYGLDGRECGRVTRLQSQAARARLETLAKAQRRAMLRRRP